jgi:hypothetical protein
MHFNVDNLDIKLKRVEIRNFLYPFFELTNYIKYVHKIKQLDNVLYHQINLSIYSIIRALK